MQATIAVLMPNCVRRLVAMSMSMRFIVDERGFHTVRSPLLEL